MQKKRNVFGKKRVRNIIEGFLFSPQSSFYVLGSWACNKFTYNYASLSAPEASWWCKKCFPGAYNIENLEEIKIVSDQLGLKVVSGNCNFVIIFSSLRKTGWIGGWLISIDLFLSVIYTAVLSPCDPYHLSHLPLIYSDKIILKNIVKIVERKNSSQQRLK